MRILVDAWDISMAAIFLVLESTGMWKLAKVNENGRVMPHHTKRLEDFIMWFGIIITTVLMVYGLIKVALWKGWILP